MRRRLLLAITILLSNGSPLKSGHVIVAVSFNPMARTGYVLVKGGGSGSGRRFNALPFSCVFYYNMSKVCS